MRRPENKSFAEEESPDLTPLVDCVFLLLIFFMLTTAFLHIRGLEVDLPAKSEATEQQEKKDINVVIDEEGKVQIGGDYVEKRDLVDEMKKAMKEANNDNIIVQAAEKAYQEHVVDVVDAAKEAGVQGIAFVREEGEQGLF
jgi:biopolymer transport protein ExbD